MGLISHLKRLFNTVIMNEFVLSRHKVLHPITYRHLLKLTSIKDCSVKLCSQ